MKKHFAVFVLIICFMLSSVAFAENVAADKYHKLFNSGEYFVEYEVETNSPYIDAKMKKYIPKEVKSLAVHNGQIKAMANHYMSDFSTKRSNAADLTLGVFKNGRYYYCVSKKKGYIFNVSNLEDVQTMNIMMGGEAGYAVSAATTEMRLPDGIRNIFVADNNVGLTVFKAEFKNSTQEVINGITYDVDEYLSSMVGMNGAYGTSAFETRYKVYYQNNVLNMIIMSYNNGNSFIYKFNIIKDVVTDDMLSVPVKYKFYSAPIYNMNGLLHDEVLAEET